MFNKVPRPMFFCLVLLFAGLALACLGCDQKTQTNSIGMEFVLIPAGSFFQEDLVKDVNGESYLPKMIVSKPFYLGKYEVTQAQWVAVMGSNPSKTRGMTNPVDNVSWNDVQEFTKGLNAREKTNKYRLPTEAEWELAARGGTDTVFFFKETNKDTTKDTTWGNAAEWEDAARQLDAYAWFEENRSGRTHPVGQKKPNPYGLYDVYGNVFEWVQDGYEENLPQDREIVDYQGPAGGGFTRVIRGGGWLNGVQWCRSGSRALAVTHRRVGSIGFRLAFSPE